MFFLLILPVSLSLDSNILGDVSVSGTFSCASLSASTLTAPGTVTTTSSVTSSDTTTSSTKTTELSVSSIYPQSSKITIESDLIIYPPSTSASFYQISWQLFSHNSFKNSSEGWSGDLKTCNEDSYIEGSSSSSVSKTLKLPVGSYIKLSSSIHFIDLWQGESVSLKVAGKTLWSRSVQSGSVNICGSSQADAGYAVPLEVSFKYDSGLIEFVSDIDREKGRFGVDDVIIYIK